MNAEFLRRGIQVVVIQRQQWYRSSLFGTLVRLAL